MYFLLLILLLSPSISYSQTITENIVNKFFDLNEQNSLSYILGGLTSLSLIIGGFIIAYTIIIWVTQTAQEGKFLNKNSSLWGPIRIALGTALIMPIFSGGVSLIQVIITSLLVNSSSFAESVWEKYILSGNTVISSTKYENIDFSPYALKILSSNVCLESVKKILSQNGVVNIKPNIEKIDYKNHITYEYGFLEQIGINKDSCGIVEIPKKSFSINNLNNNFILSNPIKDALFNSDLNNTHYSSSIDMMKEMNGLAKKLVESKKELTKKEIFAVIDKYNNNIESQANKKLTTIEETLKTELSQSNTDWLMSGFFYSKNYLIKQIIDTQVNSFGLSTGPGIIENKVLAAKHDEYQKILQSSLGQESFLFYPDSLNSKQFSSNDINNILKSDFFLNLEKTFQPRTQEHTLFQIQDFGNKISSIGSESLQNSLKLLLLNNSQSSFINLVVLVFSVPLIAIGSILSYSILLMPAFFWVIALSTWFIMALSLLLFSPIWSISHFLSDGNEVFGKGAKGYKFLLMSMIKPIFLISFLLISYFVIDTLGGLINNFFFSFSSITVSNINTITALTGLIFQSLIYTFLICFFIYKVFKLSFNSLYYIEKYLGGSNSNQQIDVYSTNNSTSTTNEIEGFKPNFMNNIQNVTSIIKNGANSIMGNKSFDSKEVVTPNKSVKRDEIINPQIKSQSLFSEYASNGWTNKIAGLEADKILNNQFNNLGGPETQESILFLDRLNGEIENQLSKAKIEQLGWKEVFENVAKHILEEKFAKKTSDVLERVGGGDIESNGSTKKSYFSQDFNEGMKLYYKVLNQLKKKYSGDDQQVKKILSEVNRKILFLYIKSKNSIKNGGDKTIGSFMKEELNKIFNDS